MKVNKSFQKADDTEGNRDKKKTVLKWEKIIKGLICFSKSAEVNKRKTLSDQKGKLKKGKQNL